MIAAPDLIREAEAQGVHLFVEGEKLKWRSKSPIHDELLGRLREHKPEVIGELRREGADSRAEKQESPGVGRRSSSSSSLPRGTGDNLCPAGDDPCPGSTPTPERLKQDLVREAIEALKFAREYRVWFHLEGDNVRIEHWPQMPAYPLARLRKASKGIAAILLSPLRPSGYSNETWLQAVLEADRIGYPLRWMV